MAYSDNITKYLDDQKLLPKGTWTAPNMLRLKSIWKELWLLFPFFFLTVALTVGFWSAAVAQGALWVLLGFLAVVTGLTAWGVAWFGHFHWRPFYTVNGVTVHFDDPKWYVDPKVMEAFLQEIFDKWDSREVVDFPSKQMLDGSHLYLQDVRPTDPIGRVEQKRMVGLTYSSRRRSYVYAPYALSHGGAGYELRLQMVHIIRPSATEEEHVEWFIENDVI